MYKKLLAAALITSMLVLPVNSTGPAVSSEAPPAGPAQDYLPGDVPAQTDAAESMAPAFHALVLVMLNHDADQFPFADSSLNWEALYNMLSLYGQLDSRSVIEKGEMLFPEETLLDYAAALSLTAKQLDSPPAALRDRLNYDNVSRCYAVVCGEDNLAQIRVDSVTTAKGSCLLTGVLVYEVENQVLARFQAVFQPRDNMFGCAVTSLTLR